jgi:hypothetical protein
MYGAGTKWCTTNRDRDYQYFKYTKSGLLVYIIDNELGKKYAYYRNMEQRDNPGEVLSQFFTTMDAQVDSVDLGLPDKILKVLKDFVATSEYKCNFDHPNYERKEWEEFQRNENCCKPEAPREVAAETNVEPMADEPELEVTAPTPAAWAPTAQ